MQGAHAEQATHPCTPPPSYRAVMTTRATPAKAAAEIRAELEGLRKDLPTLEDRCHQADAALQAAAAEVIKARELLAGQHHTINELEAQAAQLEAQP